MFGICGELKKAIQKRGIMDQLEAHMVCKKVENIIIEKTASTEKGFRVVKYLKNTKTVEIEVKSMEMGQAIRIEEKLLLNKINQDIGKVCIQRIRYRLV